MTDASPSERLVASALSMTAKATSKGAVGEAAKDAYGALKAKVAAWVDFRVVDTL
jgi:hypothetical protein